MNLDPIVLIRAIQQIGLPRESRDERRGEASVPT